MDSDILILTDEDANLFNMMGEEEEENDYMDVSSSPPLPSPPPIDLENDNPSLTRPIPTYSTTERHHLPLVDSKDRRHRPSPPPPPPPPPSFSDRYRLNRYPSNTFHPTRRRRPPSDHHRSFVPTRFHDFMIVSTTDKGYTLTSNSVWRSRFQHFGIAEWTNDILNFMRQHPVEIIYVPNRITQRRVMRVIENSDVPVCVIPVPPHILGDSRKMASYIAYLLNENTIYHRRTPYRGASMRYTPYSSHLNRR